MVHLILVKTTFIKDYCGLYETVNVFCIDGSEWKEYNIYMC